MDVYRFMGEARLGPFLNGTSIALGRLQYYRLMEMAYGDRHIGDKREGSRETRVSTKPSDPDHAHVIDQLSDNFKGVTGRISIAPSVMTRFTDAYVLSCSMGPIEELLAAIQQGHFGPQPYNGCVAISGAEDFAHTIWAQGIASELGVPIRELFEPPLVGPVTYGDAEPGDIHDGPLAAPDAFMKSRFYAGQREWRILLRPRFRIPGAYDRIVLSCPAAAIHLRREEIDVPQSDPQEQRDAAHWLDVLRELCSARPAPPKDHVARAYFEYRSLTKPDEELDHLILLDGVSSDVVVHYIERNII